MTRCNVLLLNRMAPTSEVCVKKGKKSMAEGRCRLARSDGVVRGEGEGRERRRAALAQRGEEASRRALLAAC